MATTPPPQHPDDRSSDEPSTAGPEHATGFEASQELSRAAAAVQHLEPRRSWSDSRVMGYREARRAIADMLTASAGKASSVPRRRAKDG